MLIFGTAATGAEKALEAVLTPLVELIWPKRRILEVYLNIAEFDEGVFGVKAAAQHYFGVTPAKLSPLQAARLAAILPAPKDRSASKPSNYIRKRTARIRGRRRNNPPRRARQVFRELKLRR